MRKKLLIVAMMIAISIPLIAYAWSGLDKGMWTRENYNTPSDVAGKNQETLPNVTMFEAIVNNMTRMDVFVCVDISDGLTEKEAELIVGTTFIQVMGEYVWHQLDSLTFDNAELRAHYNWGHDETDLGHICDVVSNLTTLKIVVDHCF
ncbi:MAG: hypothetical protein JSV64_02130 [Candidatus Bathyarchaeota archaeon]|nr:MAG: hypothetical protein JSV64_02130 [Candidatus Bathyarchaeota archaeon]